MTLLLTSCARQEYQADPIDAEQVYLKELERTSNRTDLNLLLSSLGYRSPETDALYNFQTFALSMLYYHPSLDVVMSEITVKQAGELIAAQKQNPVLQIPLEHHSDTSGGVSPWLIGFVLDFIYERKGKREARMDKALAETEYGRIKLEKVAWELLWEFHQTWFQYLAAVETDHLINEEIELRKEVVELLQRRSELGEGSNFEVSSSRIAYQRSLLLSSQQSIIRNNYLQSLMALSGMSMSEAKNLDHAVLEEEFIKDAISKPGLQEIALHQRYDVRLALQEYATYEADLRLEIEKQYPDITLSPGFIFDQDDKLWALGAQWLLPIFNQREGEIQQALAQRHAMQKRFVSLQSEIIRQIDQSWADYQFRQQAYDKVTVLLDELTARENEMKKQYDLGYLDRVEYLRSQLETLQIRRDSFVMKMDVLDAWYRLKKSIQFPLLKNPELSEFIVVLLKERLEQAP